MSTQAVLFDFGGVLFNWQPARLIQTVWPHLARNDAEALELAQAVFQSFVPGSEWSEFDRGALPADEVARQIAARTGLTQADVRILMDAIPPHLAPVAPTVRWLEALADQGVPLYFLSNMPAPYRDHLLAHHGFLGRFQGGVFSCEVGQVKPNADIFHTTAERLGLEPARTVFVDDHPRNIDMARALGWRAMLFTDAAQCQQALAEQGWLPEVASAR